MDREDAVWLAAVVDCEGTLYLNRVRPRTPRPAYQPVLTIKNTYLPLLERASALLDGRPIRMVQANGLNKKPCFEVRAYRRRTVYPVLTAIEPFLMEKRALARELIAWCEWREFGAVISNVAEYEAHAARVRALHSRAI